MYNTFAMRILRMRKRYWALFIIVLAVLGFIFLSRKNGKPAVTSRIERGEVERTLVLSGEVIANTHAKLAFQTSGTLARVNVEEGETVKKGKVLASLDTAQLNSSYESAKSSLRLTAATRDKIYDSLKDKGNSETFTEKETRITAEVAHDKAYEAFKQAEKALRDANLVAPFAGLVSSITTKTPGSYITVAVTQIEIIDPETLVFAISADQTEIVDIKEGQKVTLTLDVKDENIDGTVSFVGKTPIAGATESLYRVEIDADLISYDWLKIGMSGDATLHLEKKEDVLYVDPSFIKQDSNGEYLQLGKDKRRVNIKRGLEGEDRVEIISDEIREGDEIYD